MADLAEAVSIAVLKVMEIWVLEVTFCEPPAGNATVTEGTVVEPPNGPELLLLPLEQFIDTTNQISKPIVTSKCFFKLNHPFGSALIGRRYFLFLHLNREDSLENGKFIPIFWEGVPNGTRLSEPARFLLRP